MPLSTLGSATSRAFGFKGLSAFTNWFGTFAGTSNTYTALSIDSSGSLYTGMDAAAGAMKIANAGTVSFQKSISGIGGLAGNALDSSGNLYSVTYGGTIYKYDSTGTLQWQKTLSTIDGATGIAVDSSGNIHVCGSLYTGVYFRGFIAKLSSAGAITWQRYATKATTTSDGISFGAVAVDGSGNVYVSGSDTASGQTVNSAVLVKYNSSGTIQWQRKLTASPATAFLTAQGLAVDSSGNTYLGISNSTTFNNTYFLKYNTSGTIQWQRQISGTNNSATLSKCFIYNNTDVYFTGFQDAGIAKYNTSGVIQWQRELFDSGTLRGIVADADKFYFVTRSGVVAKLPNDGSRTGTYGLYIYQNGARTEQAGTLTDAAGSFTDAAGSLTIANASGTESTTSKTLTLTGVS